MNFEPADNSELVELSRYWKKLKEYGLCPNRVWAAVRSHPWNMKILPYLTQRRMGEPLIGHEGHDHIQCLYDLCKLSRLKFLKSPQRHESSSCARHPCSPLRGWFPEELLKEAITTNKLTAWTLDGKSILEPPRPFMAISHIWSDGTGKGGRAHGEVNRCLYDYFRRIAEMFQCEGIWWDTVCTLLPKRRPCDPDRVHEVPFNQTAIYGAARITLVHDCYLREWEWFDAETACFAIIMSPWYGRGWTALELARSRKVKIIFKNSVIKDLDEDILVTPQSTRHRIAYEMIINLRKGTITAIDDLLQVLNSRACCSLRDMAVVSGLLTGVTVDFPMYPSTIYQDILVKIGMISHDHLFFKSPHMPAPFTWCPANLLDMQISTRKPVLRVCENGDVIGTWTVVHGIHNIPLELYDWTGMHTLVRVELRTAVGHPDGLVLLVEPTTINTSDEAICVTRALLAKPMGSKVFNSLGSVYFHPLLEVHDVDCATYTITISPTAGQNEGSYASSRYFPHYVIQNPAIHETTMLLRAAEKGDDRIVQSLLHRGVDPNTIGENGLTPLLYAVINERKTTVKYLLEHGADPNLKDEQRSWTALHYVSWQYHDSVDDDLLVKSDHTIEDRLGQCALHLASERGNQKIIAQLLYRGANPNARCKQNQTALHRAAFSGSANAVQQLLASRADPSLCDFKGQTAIHLAAQYGYKEVAELLAECLPSAINIMDAQGNTPLHIASRTGEETLVKFLLEKGAFVDVLNRDGWGPLHMAAESGNEAIVQLLRKVESRASCDSWKLVHSTAKGGLEGIVSELLLCNKSYSRLRDSEGRLPLHKAAEGGSERVANLLLQNGADIRAVDNFGRTALMDAAQHGHRDVVELLLKEGADIGTKDQNGRTALILAAENMHEDIVHQLRNVSGVGVFETRDCSGRNALLRAADREDENVMELLLDHGADIEAKTYATTLTVLQHCQ